MKRALVWTAALIGGAWALALIFWGWQQGGMALLQLGMSIC